MTITVPLDPHEEAKLVAAARARGLFASALVREALDKILADAAEPGGAPEQTRSLRGLLARYGPAPSDEEIEENRKEMLANFPRSHF